MKCLTSHFALLLLLTFTLSSCRDTPESLTEDLIQSFEEGTKMLEKISAGEEIQKDLSNLEKWVEENNTIVAKMTAFTDELEQDKTREKKLESTYGVRRRAAVEAFMSAFSQTKSSKYAKDVESTIRKLRFLY